MVSLLALGALTASAALALTDFSNAPQGAHYARGFGEPVCTSTDTGATVSVSCTGTQIEGVGHTNALQVLAVNVSATGVCHNPGVNSKVVEPFTRTATVATSATLTAAKNGRLVVPGTSAAVDAADVLQGFTCPNANWTPEVTDLSITSFTYTLTFVGFAEPAIEITG